MTKQEATHYIKCYETAGKGRKRILFQICKFIKVSKSGNAVVQTVGLRDNEGGIRHVPFERLIDMYEQTPCNCKASMPELKVKNGNGVVVCEICNKPIS